MLKCRWSLVCLIGLGLAACDDDEGSVAETDGGEMSGGGDSDDVPVSAYCSSAAGWDDDLAAFEERVLEIVNEERARGADCGGQQFLAAPPLRMDSALRCAARVHSKDMGDRNFFSHDNLEGQTPFERMELAGYMYSAAGENIAAGQISPEDVMRGWMQSPGHCRNIMSPDYVDFGVGAYEADASDFPIYWTQTFGAPL